ncbi:MAG TPA: RcpC/CpaB family pilus assembly protein, partial [Sphingomicrobium sp.]|nr:RcpC/CpaB family pilus assembly protein [Sphingomicrobium sp.]
QQVTDVLLQNVRVIAMGQDASGGSNQPVVQRSATLEVSPVDAQKLTLGQALGQLSLVLRKPGDEQNIPQVETVSLHDLRYSYSSSLRPANAAQPAPQRARIARLSQPRRAPVQRAAAPVRPATSTVSVTRGLETKDYEVGGYAH